MAALGPATRARRRVRHGPRGPRAGPAGHRGGRRRRRRSMLATARRLGPALTGSRRDLGRRSDLDRVFDVVVMAGNVSLFTPPGTEEAVVARCAAPRRAGGVLIAGFQLGGGRYDLDRYDGSAPARASSWPAVRHVGPGAMARRRHLRRRSPPPLVVGSVDEVLEDGGIALGRVRSVGGARHHEIGDVDLRVRSCGSPARRPPNRGRRPVVTR